MFEVNFNFMDNMSKELLILMSKYFNFIKFIIAIMLNSLEN